MQGILESVVNNIDGICNDPTLNLGYTEYMYHITGGCTKNCGTVVSPFYQLLGLLVYIADMILKTKESIHEICSRWFSCKSQTSPGSSMFMMHIFFVGLSIVLVFRIIKIRKDVTKSLQ